MKSFDYYKWYPKWIEALKTMGLEILYIEGFDAKIYVTVTQIQILKKLRDITAPLLRNHLQAIPRDNKKPDKNF